MSKLAVFRRQASAGSMVTLRLTRGEDVSGRVTEVDENHLCVDIGYRVVTIFEDILAGWEVHHPELTAEEQSARGLANEQPVSNAGQTLEPDRATTNIESAARLHSVVVARRARIDATFTEGVKRARLEPPELNFTFPDNELPDHALSEVRREWERAHNQYEYALKVREHSRLNTVVGQVLRPLADRYPKSPAIRALLGNILLKLERRAEAVELLRAAAVISGKREHWYALAFAASGSALECLALRNYLLLPSQEELGDAWFRYFAVALDHSDVVGIIQLLDRYLGESASNAARELASESLIYVYGRFGTSDAPDAASAALVGGAPFPPEGGVTSSRTSSRGLLQSFCKRRSG